MPEEAAGGHPAPRHRVGARRPAGPFGLRPAEVPTLAGGPFPGPRDPDVRPAVRPLVRRQQVPPGKGRHLSEAGAKRVLVPHEPGCRSRSACGRRCPPPLPGRGLHLLAAAVLAPAVLALPRQPHERAGVPVPQRWLLVHRLVEDARQQPAEVPHRLRCRLLPLRAAPHERFAHFVLPCRDRRLREVLRGAHVAVPERRQDVRLQRLEARLAVTFLTRGPVLDRRPGVVVETEPRVVLVGGRVGVASPFTRPGGHCWPASSAALLRTAAGPTSSKHSLCHSPVRAPPRHHPRGSR